MLLRTPASHPPAHTHALVQSLAEAAAKAADLQAQIDSLATKHAQDMAIAEKKEQEFFKQITRLTTEVDALTQQVTGQCCGPLFCA